MSDGQLAEGALFGGDHRVLRVIHTGGLSTLYEVENTSTGVHRALKVVHGALGRDPKLRELFLEEAKRIGRVESDHVAELIACGVDAATDLPYAITELLQGETLAALVARRGALTPREAREILEQTTHALAAAHDVGLVHRDLKPESIFLAQSRSSTASFRVAVLFLGIGKLASEAKHNTTAAMSRPLWMAPEQAETDATPTPATDVWSLGLLAYLALTGRSYWKTARDMGSAMMSLMREVLFEDVAPASQRAREQGVLDNLPFGFDPWFERCLARDPAQRFQHARAAMQELSASLEPFARAYDERLARQSAPQGPPEPSNDAAGSPPRAMGPLPPPTPPPPPAAPRQQSFGSLPPPNPPPRASGAPPRTSAEADRRALVIGLVASGVAALAVLVAIGIGIGFFFVRREAARAEAASRADDTTSEHTEKKVEPWSDEACPVPVSSKDPVWGERLAPATIVEFSDFECPFCKRAEDTLALLKKSYGPKKLRVVWKNEPLTSHPNAKPAAIAAMAVFDLEGSDAFWKFHKRAYGDQTHLDADAFARWASLAGADRRSFTDKLGDDAIAKKVSDDTALGQSLGVKGTPAFFVNGRLLSGALPKDKFEEAIDLALAEAKVEGDKGTAPDKIYVTLTQRNYKKDTPAPDPQDDHTLYRVPVGGSPVLGPKTALVTIVEFADFQCPFCGRAEATLSQLRAHYGDKIRIVWKDAPLPFHKRAMPAASFAREVRAKKGDDAFWRAHDLLFANQKNLEDADLQTYSSTLGFDGTALAAAAQSEAHKKEIAEDQDLADAIGATGTPVFYIDGRKLNGAQPYEKFATIIDEELPKAQALVAKGILAENVYDELTKDGSVGKLLETKDPGPVPAGAPARGAKKPLVVIQEFSDLECPYCKRAEATLDDVVREYGDKVQIVWRHFPLTSHKHAELAAEAAEEVKAQKGDKAFFDFGHKVFEAQPNGLERSDLTRLAVAQGVDLARFDKALDAHTHAARVAADVAAAQKLGFTGTPTFVVGKYVVTGAQPLAAFRRAIDKALADPK